ncbi:putative E3 ubiquitin-protein ligase HERC1 [Symbiodinium microadriaticum]|uniref:Putative E3 ubiquitin-protein ligase HERC1 n=1 Tax=Symbiodinium microadriaticum TaxID=2951 RepID=A0A1Q9EBK0_SYMMI|nr:putative E3 ubiquitin-protein ligase HERC1 [Symbiodinium microadriaticum]
MDPGSSLHRYCRIAAGGAHSLIVTERNDVLAWGSNSHGQVGNGSLEDVLNPTVVVDPGHARYVFAGRSFSLMIDMDGWLWGWGCNEDNILGIPTAIEKQQVPVKLDTGGRRIKHVSGGWKHILAVCEDGQFMSWGNNDYGQLGDGSTRKRREPDVTLLPDGAKAAAVSAGWYHSLVLTETGEVLGAGMGYGGTSRGAGEQFVQVIRAGVSMISAGSTHNLAVTRTGTVLAWGANEHGQVGNGLLDFQAAPTAVCTKQMIVAAGGSHSLCANDAYHVSAWGHGVLPANDSTLDCPARYSVSEPTLLEFPDGAFSIAAGDAHTLIVGPLGQVGAYGSNMSGQIGNNSLIDSGRLVEILSSGTVEVISQEARMAAAMKGPAEEYMLDNKPNESADVTGAVQLALGPRSGALPAIAWRPGRRQISEPGLLHVEKPEGLGIVEQHPAKVYTMTEKRHVRQVESKAEFSDKPNGKRTVYRENGLRAIDQPALEVDVTTEMARKARVGDLHGQRNGIDCRVLGDKCFRFPEYEPSFYKAGGLIAGSTFHRGMCKKTQPRNSSSVVVVMESTGSRPPIKSYQQKQLELQVQEAQAEVVALTKSWENETLKDCDNSYLEPLDSDDEQDATGEPAPKDETTKGDAGKKAK